MGVRCVRERRRVGLWRDLVVVEEGALRRAAGVIVLADVEDELVEAVGDDGFDCLGHEGVDERGVFARDGEMVAAELDGDFNVRREDRQEHHGADGSTGPCRKGWAKG